MILSAHMSEHNLSEPYQSAYKPNDSVETALLFVIDEMYDKRLTKKRQMRGSKKEQESSPTLLSTVLDRG